MSKGVILRATQSKWKIVNEEVEENLLGVGYAGNGQSVLVKTLRYDDVKIHLVELHFAFKLFAEALGWILVPLTSKTCDRLAYGIYYYQILSWYLRNSSYLTDLTEYFFEDFFLLRLVGNFAAGTR